MLRKGIALAALGLAMLAGPALAATTHEEPKEMSWSSEGPFGKADQAQLQRGYKVYREVCSSCHSMNLLYFRNLGQKGGPFYDEKYKNPNDNPYVKSLAKDVQVADVDTDTGDAIKREGIPADKFPAPFPNEYAARASNGGANPPDLSVMAKAREGGPNYIYSLLAFGYKPPPAGLKVGAGQYFNAYMPGDLGASWSGPKDKVPYGGFLAMPFQLTPGRVTFDDGTKSTTEQMAHDVVTFLAWAAEPHAEERKQTGLAVMIYLLIFTGLLYASYRRIWRNVAH